MDSHRSHRLSLAGLCMTAALGLLALVTPAAQAAPPEWMVNGFNVSSNLPVVLSPEIEQISFEETQKRVLVLLGETAGVPLWFTCEEVTPENIVLMASGTGSGEARFAHCKTLTRSGGVVTLNSNCTPKEPIVAAFNFSIALHGTPTKAYVKMTGANAGGRFATITISNELCAFEGSYEVKGTFWIEDCTNQFEAELLTHLIKEGAIPASKLGGLTLGGNPATLDGSVNLQLFDLTLMQKFSGLAS